MIDGTISRPIDANLALELVRATEAAALAAAQWIGRGDKNSVDMAAVDAMRLVLNAADMDGLVVIGEGEKDEAPMLYIGEEVGNGRPPSVDIAVDPIDGTTLASKGGSGAISVVAAAERGALFHTHVPYMDKIVVGPAAAGLISIDAAPANNALAIAKALRRPVETLTVAVMERPRNDDLVRELRAIGARIRLFGDGDIAAALVAMMEEYPHVDILMGIGGAPEGVVTACAVKSLGGDMQARLWSRGDQDVALAQQEGIEISTALQLDDLCRGENAFFAATGLTDGELLRGVRHTGRNAQTDSIEMRSSSGTVRRIRATHNLARLRALAGTRYSAQSTPEIV
ncbi:MAG: class II fructose-bisphosphatase [Candidatus Eremiobacteraeota bacterium]|nr:class II fructose-bisphosphatase [Candidatus Eremiobacteraeota bacterium]